MTLLALVQTGFKPQMWFSDEALRPTILNTEKIMPVHGLLMRHLCVDF